MKPAKKSRGANTAQLRDAIDRGETGSKVRVGDPAASPLGTDDEAAGTRHDPAVVEDTLRRETAASRRGRDARGHAEPRGDSSMAGEDVSEDMNEDMYFGQSQRRRTSPTAVVLGIVAVLVVAWLLLVVLR